MYNHPRFVTEEAKGEGTLSDYLGEHPVTSMIHIMKGESMRDIGILENDTLVIEKWRKPQRGDIVLAIVDDTYVVRIFDLHKGRPVLHTANPDYATLIPSESLEIRGVMVAMMRKYH